MRGFVRAAALAALCFVLATPTIAQPAHDSLEGLWVSRMHWDAGPSGELVLSRNGKTWHASIGIERADFTTGPPSLQFELPDHRGSFRGVMDGDDISGFWIQPHSAAGDPRDPDGKGQTYASPVLLKRGADGAWRGAIVPLTDSFTLYLKIFRDDKGVLTAAFRNPEINFRAGAPQFSVTHAGNTVSFIDPSKTAHRIVASFATDRLQMRFSGFDKDFTLTRAAPDQAQGFYPRPAGSPRYVYRVPDDLHDGWTVARARDTGMDETAIAQLVQGIVDTDPAAKRPDLIHSIDIAHRGKLVLDEYFAGFDANTPHDTRSAAKTFASVMLGAEMQGGAALSPNTRIYPLLAGMGPFANPDPRKNQITLAQLMTHTSGLACDDNDDNSPGSEGAVQSQRRTGDWWKVALDLPIAHDPGTRYAYCSPGINLVGAALTTASHAWLPLLFDETVARPLEWGLHYWNLMPNGEGYLGGGLFARPRDMLKLGQAWLDGGVWNGKRIASAAWVKDSTSTHAIVSPETTGLSADDFRSVYLSGEDGYAWHLTTLHTPERDYRAYGASGNGGQLLVVVPELSLVVGFTGGNYGQGLIWNAWRDKLIPEKIIPAIGR